VGEVLEVVPGLMPRSIAGRARPTSISCRASISIMDDIDIALQDRPVNMRTHGHGQGFADLIS